MCHLTLRSTSKVKEQNFKLETPMITEDRESYLKVSYSTAHNEQLRHTKFKLKNMKKITLIINLMSWHPCTFT